MDDPEELYAEGVEREGELFLEGLQNKKDIGELEKEYSKKVKEIRRIYEKSIKKDLEKERDSLVVKNKANIGGNEGKEFRVQSLDLERSWKEKKQVEVASLGYRIKRKMKNTIHRITPNWLIYLYYRIKRASKDTHKEIKDFLIKVKDKFVKKILNIFSYIKEGFLILASGIKKVLNMFKKKQKKGENLKKEENPKKEDGTKNSEKQNK